MMNIDISLSRLDPLPPPLLGLKVDSLGISGVDLWMGGGGPRLGLGQLEQV